MFINPKLFTGVTFGGPDAIRTALGATVFSVEAFKVFMRENRFLNNFIDFVDFVDFVYFVDFITCLEHIVQVKISKSPQVLEDFPLVV